MSKRRKYPAPPKNRLYATGDEQIAERLRQLRLPDPPPALRERTRSSYGQWVESRSAKNPWRG
jgi:hypothetical protein